MRDFLRRLFHIALWTFVALVLLLGIAPSFGLDKALDRLWTGTVDTQQARRDLLLAEQKWEMTQVTHYRLNIRVTTLYSLSEFVAVRNQYLCGMIEDTLTVKDGKVIDAAHLSDCADVYGKLTVEGVFALTEKYLSAESPIVAEVEFDSERGYVASLLLKYPSGGHPVSLKSSDLVILDP